MSEIPKCDREDFWQRVNDAGYAMEGESREYERQTLAGLDAYMDEWMKNHPEIGEYGGSCKPIEDWSIHAVKRLVHAFTFNDSKWLADQKRRWGRSEVRLSIDNISRDSEEYALIGHADFGAAITELNVHLVKAVAAALRKAGYTNAVLILDAEESLDLGADLFDKFEAGKHSEAGHA